MKKLTLIALSSFLFWSCNNVEKTETQPTTETHTEHESASGADAIELNDGERWLVNEEMKPFVAKGSAMVDAYLQDNQTDYTTLATSLKEQNDSLIKSCTMTGKSHDELHKWLNPHLQNVKALENAADAEKAKSIVTEIQHSYTSYHNYFN